MQVGELNLDCVGELSFGSLGACIEVRDISREWKAQIAPFHSSQAPSGFDSLLVFEHNFEVTSCEEGGRDQGSRKM